MSLKTKIALIATGGTIASKLNEHNEYISGTQAINTIIPKHLLTNIDIYAPFSIDSANLSYKKLFKLNKLIQKLANQYDAIIVTHGTDTMCESAFFTYLTNKSSKSIIFTGAMRSSTDEEFDGVKNFEFALSNIDKNGVFIAMNNSLINAKDCVKSNTLAFDSFIFKQSPNIPMGIFKLSKQYSKCTILHSYANDNCKLPKKGTIIYAGVGNGNIPKKSKQKLAKIAHKRPVIRASICCNGQVTQKIEDKEYGFIASGYFSPLQARVVAILAQENIKEIFKRYAYEI